MVRPGGCDGLRSQPARRRLPRRGLQGDGPSDRCGAHQRSDSARSSRLPRTSAPPPCSARETATGKRRIPTRIVSAERLFSAAQSSPAAAVAAFPCGCPRIQRFFGGTPDSCLNHPGLAPGCCSRFGGCLSQPCTVGCCISAREAPERGRSVTPCRCRPAPGPSHPDPPAARPDRAVPAGPADRPDPSPCARRPPCRR